MTVAQDTSDSGKEEREKLYSFHEIDHVQESCAIFELSIVCYTCYISPCFATINIFWSINDVK